MKTEAVKAVGHDTTVRASVTDNIEMGFLYMSQNLRPTTQTNGFRLEVTLGTPETLAMDGDSSSQLLLPVYTLSSSLINKGLLQDVEAFLITE